MSQDISLQKGQKMAKPCKRDGCAHYARDHKSKGKKVNGSWWGACDMPTCDCKEYIA